MLLPSLRSALIGLIGRRLDPDCGTPGHRVVLPNEWAMGMGAGAAGATGRPRPAPPVPYL